MNEEKLTFSIIYATFISLTYNIPIHCILTVKFKVLIFYHDVTLRKKRKEKIIHM